MMHENPQPLCGMRKRDRSEGVPGYVGDGALFGKGEVMRHGLAGAFCVASADSLDNGRMVLEEQIVILKGEVKEGDKVKVDVDVKGNVVFKAVSSSEKH